ncbi:MAG: hypothetical protein ACKO80_02340, partial [Acidimicrobiaceae bacterium]
MFIYIQREGIALVLNLRRSVARSASITWRLFVAVFLIATTLAVDLTRNEQPAFAAACASGSDYSTSSSGTNPTTYIVTFSNTSSSCTYTLPSDTTSIDYLLVGGGGGGGGG